MMHGMHGTHGMLGHGNWMMILFMIFWIVLIGGGIYLLVKFINSDNKNVNHKHHPNKNTPLQTLQERLAMGEIDEEEYERLKTIIKQDQKK